MCLNPITIKNKYIYDRLYQTFRHGSVSVPFSGRTELSLPCGKCQACLQQKKDDMYLRARNEYISNGKRAIFHTLTYDPFFRPSVKFVIPSDIVLLEEEFKERVYPDKPYPTYWKTDIIPIFREGVEEDISCWDKTHVQAYLKALNEKIIYIVGKKRGITRLSHGKITEEWRTFLREFGRPLKYLLVCERGKANIYKNRSGRVRVGQQCPHYHVILFLQCPDSDFTLKELKRLSVSEWKYGLSYPLIIRNSKGDIVRDEYKAISYVCKYITKQDEELSYNLTYTYDNEKRTEKISPSRCFYPTHQDELRYKPFNLISNWLGASWLDNTDFTFIIDRLLTTGVSDISSTNSRCINLPAYYLNKIRYKSCRLSDDYHTSDTKDYNPKIIPFLDGYISNVRYEPIIDYSYGYPVLAGWEYVPSTPSRYANLPTEFHDTIQRTLLHNKATYISNLLVKYRNDIPSIEYVYTHDKKFRDVSPDIYPLVDLLQTTSPDDLYNYVVNYYHTSESDDNLSWMVDMLLYVSRYYSKQAYDEREITYRANLRKAMNATPELFNITPLCTN